MTQDGPRAVVNEIARRLRQKSVVENPGLDAELACFIDHTLLRADATEADLAALCAEAKAYGFATVCVSSSHMRFCAAALAASDVVPIAAVGFPSGAATAAAKAFETREAVRHGAAEIDMVLNVGALKGGEYHTVLRDVLAVVQAAAPMPVKVILETGLLNHDEIVAACTLCKVGGAAFVKTSTGFGPRGASVDDILLMRSVVGPHMGVKASGGIRTAAAARALLAAGANRLGASASVSIVGGDPKGSGATY